MLGKSNVFHKIFTYLFLPQQDPLGTLDFDGTMLPLRVWENFVKLGSTTNLSDHIDGKCGNSRAL